MILWRLAKHFLLAKPTSWSLPSSSAAKHYVALVSASEDAEEDSSEFLRSSGVKSSTTFDRCFDISVGDKRVPRSFGLMSSRTLHDEIVLGFLPLAFSR